MANRNDHLANERTFLAWIRTSLGIMAFGFIIVKCALFIRQISFVIKEATPPPGHGYSYVMGISLVAFGAAITILACVKYRMTEKQIEQETYRPSFVLSAILAAAALAHRDLYGDLPDPEHALRQPEPKSRHGDFRACFAEAGKEPQGATAPPAGAKQV